MEIKLDLLKHNGKTITREEIRQKIMEIQQTSIRAQGRDPITKFDMDPSSTTLRTMLEC